MPKEKCADYDYFAENSVSEFINYLSFNQIVRVSDNRSCRAIFCGCARAVPNNASQLISANPIERVYAVEALGI